MIPEKSMLLVSSHREGVPTFRMMPLTNDCPYLEAVYIPQVKAIVVFLKHAIEGLHMVPKIDDSGDMIQRIKGGAKDQSPYKQERKLLKVSHECYIYNPPEIENFIKIFAHNSEFDYKQFMTEPKATIIEPEKSKIIIP